MTFEEFIQKCEEDRAKGIITVTEGLDPLEYATMFAIVRIGERKGYPYNVTLEELCQEIASFAPELMREDEDET